MKSTQKSKTHYDYIMLNITQFSYDWERARINKGVRSSTTIQCQNRQNTSNALPEIVSILLFKQFNKTS